MTSAATVSQIIDFLTENKCNRDSALKLLEKEGLLPKKLIKAEKPKKEVSRWASNAAREAAEAALWEPAEDFKGSNKDGKITLKDVKAEVAKTTTSVNATPQAKIYARDHGVNLETVTGTGADGKISLKDAKAANPKEGVAPFMTNSPKFSAKAAKLVKEWDLDGEVLGDDLKEIKGTGKGGIIKEGDLKDIIEAAKEIAAGESQGGSESESESESE